jgi:hypothetical protein
MKNVYFIKLKHLNIMNEIFSLINTIIYAFKINKKVIVFDNCFFNLNEMNNFLKKYNILLVNKTTSMFKINAIFYGEGNNVIDITDLLTKSGFIPSGTYIPNILVNDPSPGNKKQLYYNYSFDENEYYEIYDEYIEKDIYFDIKNILEFNDSGNINIIDKNMFDDIIKNIHFKSYYYSLFNNLNEKLNVIDSRNINEQMSELIIEKIKKYIDPKVNTFILCEDIVRNLIIEFMNNNGFKYIVNVKNDNIIENEINDLIYSKYCTDVFIGHFNKREIIGSYSSYYLYHNINCINKILLEI